MKSKYSFIQILFFLFFSGCHFNSLSHKEIVEAQEAIDAQNFKRAEQKLVSALEFDIDENLKIKALHQLGVIRAFHLDDLNGALDVFIKTLEIAKDEDTKKKSRVYLANLYYESLRDYEKSAPLFKTLSANENDNSFRDTYFYRYVRSLYETQNFTKVLYLTNNIKENSTNLELSMLRALSLYFSGRSDDSLMVLENIEKFADIALLAEVKFFKALILEDREFLKESYSEYVELLKFFPNPDLVKIRIKELIKRKRNIKR